MKVGDFNEILLWPLRLTKANNDGAPDIDDAAEFLLKENGKWSEHKDLSALAEEKPINALTPDKQQEAYAAQVYFHPFIQDFLFNKQNDLKNRPLRVFRRKDVTGKTMTVEFTRKKIAPGDIFEGELGEGDKHKIDIRIESVDLYLFDSGTAILVTRLHIPENHTVTRFLTGGHEISESFNIFDVMALQDQIRRVYPPYLTGEVTTGASPFGVKIHGFETSENINRTNESHTSWTARHNSAPIASPWYELLYPLFHEHEDKDKTRYPYRVAHLFDDRQIIMSHIAVDHPSYLKDGDFIRLCFADMPGKSDDKPYGSEFLGDFNKNHTYDRFWDADTSWMNTRYLISDYTFVAIGQKESFFTSRILSHFKNIYFRSVLLVVHQRAALLALEYRISNAIKDHAECEKADDKFIENVKDIHRDLLQFHARYRFADVTTQQQGAELYDKISERMKITPLFDGISEEIKTINEYVNTLEQSRQTEAANRLARVATVFTAISIPYMVFSSDNGLFFGLNLETISDSWKMLKAFDLKYFNQRLQTTILFGILICAYCFFGKVKKK